MENGKIHLKHIFIGILGMMMIFIIYLSCDNSMEIWNTVVLFHQKTFRSPSPTPSEEPQWDDPEPFHVAYPRNYKFIMDDTPACRTKNPFLVLMVPVAPKNVDVRDAIRKTWGSEKMVLGQLVETLFFVGLPGGEDAGQQQENLNHENQQNHDLIQSSFQDSYYNLTIKTMVMMEWAAARCNNSSYIMKIDSDVLPHVPNLVKLLMDPSTAKQNYMTGCVWWHSPVVRDRNNRFYLPPDVIAESEYPPYPLGMGYVMSTDLAEKILSVSSEIKPIYIEDAYLGMCLKHMGLAPTNPPAGSWFLVDPTHPLTNCTLTNILAVMTTGIPLMTNYWERSKDPEIKC